jgi:F-type H+-transporting ATPase subunit b
MQFSWWTLAIQAVNFLVLVWLLQRLLYRPVQDVIAKRRQLSQQATVAAEKAKAEAAALKQHYEQALAGIEAERDRVFDTLRAEIEAERKKALDEAHRASGDLIAQAKARTEAESAKTLESLRMEVVDLATRLARTILADLARSVADDIPLRRLELQLAAMPPPERQILDKEIASNNGGVTVVTAHHLTLADQNNYKSQLEKALERPLNVAFESDPSLLSGVLLRVPHLVIGSTWADQLEQAREALKRGNGAKLS